MTTKRNELKSRMAVAATRRAEPETPASGQTAVRTKPVRITIDLDPADYTALNRWIETTAATLNPDDVPVRRLSQSAAVRAMIQAAVNDKNVASIVTSLLRPVI